MGKSQISPSRISTCLAKKTLLLFVLFLLVKKRLRGLCFYAFPSHKFCVYKLKLVDGFPLIQVKIKSTCPYATRFFCHYLQSWPCDKRGVRLYLYCYQISPLDSITFFSCGTWFMSFKSIWWHFWCGFLNNKFVSMWRKALPQKLSYGSLLTTSWV